MKKNGRREELAPTHEKDGNIKRRLEAVKEKRSEGREEKEQGEEKVVWQIVASFACYIGQINYPR
jgi:hypothetical protein